MNSNWSGRAPRTCEQAFGNTVGLKQSRDMGGWILALITAFLLGVFCALVVTEKDHDVGLRIPVCASDHRADRGSK